MRKLNVAVLMGGISSEREVSLTSGSMILKALDSAKYNAFPVDTALIGRKTLPEGMAGLRTDEQDTVRVHSLDDIVTGNGVKPDVAFIALHGRFGEDGTVQGMLELLGVPYVGSGVLASALAIDKIMSRKVLQAEGIPMAKGIAVDSSCDPAKIRTLVKSELGFPVVVKPNCEGSSIGLSIVKEESQFEAALAEAFKYDCDVLLEEYISGTEITVPVLGNDELNPLAVIEIVPVNSFYDYESKYVEGCSKHIIPARLSESGLKLAFDLAVKCHKALGCRGMSRTDMIVRDGDIYVLELNTIPGMTPTSLLPDAARAVGIEFSRLLDLLIGYALEGREVSGGT